MDKYRLAHTGHFDHPAALPDRAEAAVARLDLLLNGKLLAAGSREAERAWWRAKVEIKRYLGMLPASMIPQAAARIREQIISGEDFAA
jgi:hypothetical protein